MDETQGLAEGLSDGAEGIETDSNLGAEQPEPTTDAGTDAAVDAPTFTVKVNGEDIEVTQEELLSGYQRQTDYTRKTQEVARQAEALKRAAAIQEALERDPAEALKVLSEAYGVDLAPDADEDLMDPMERKQRELERQITSLQQTARQAQIDRTLSELKTTYGDFDEEALFAHSLKTGIHDLRAAYRDMTYDERIASAAKTPKTEAKREAGVVHEGGIPKNATSPKSATKVPQTIREAWAQAAQELGMTA